MTGRNKCNFSIDHILNVAGSTSPPNCLEHLHYDWLNCTRYHPPRIQRPRKKEGVQRRNAGRNPRIPFSPPQVSILESKFQTTPYLSSHEVQQIAAQLQLAEVRVKIWFQNRRARERREKEPQKATGAKENTTQDIRLSLIVRDFDKTTHIQTKACNEELPSNHLPVNLRKDNLKFQEVLPYIDKKQKDCGKTVLK